MSIVIYTCICESAAWAQDAVLGADLLAETWMSCFCHRQGPVSYLAQVVKLRFEQYLSVVACCSAGGGYVRDWLHTVLLEGLQLMHPANETQLALNPALE